MIRWRSGLKDHRIDLRGFVCEDPENVIFDYVNDLEWHLAPWEFEVQKHIRRLNPPMYLPDFVYVGYDEMGLAAVIELHAEVLDYRVYVSALAVARRAIRRGLSTEVLDLVSAVPDRLEWDYAWQGTALVHPDNHAAKAAFTKAGYAFAEMDGGYESWMREYEAV